MVRTKKKRTRLTGNLEPLEFEEALAELGQGDGPLSSDALVALSNLETAETTLLGQVWANIEPERRRQILTQLVEAGEADFGLNFEAILKSCLKDGDAGVRRRAIEGLWESEDASLIALLLDILVQDGSEDVQAVAAIALGKFTLMAELNKLRPEYASQLTDTLMAVFNDASRPVSVRRRALEAVSPLSRPEVDRAINEAYRSSNIRMRASAVYAMGKNCSVAWLPYLLSELESSEEELRYEAAGACGELGEEEAVPYLINLTEDTDSDIQRAAIQALGQIGGKEAQEHLESCLDHPDRAVREAAGAALDELEAGSDPLSMRRML